jgi:hypothetical protein
VRPDDQGGLVSAAGVSDPRRATLDITRTSDPAARDHRTFMAFYAAHRVDRPGPNAALVVYSPFMSENQRELSPGGGNCSAWKHVVPQGLTATIGNS